MIAYIKKLAFISGLTKDMVPDGIILRSRSRVKRFILCCLSPFFIIAGFFIKLYAVLRILYLERKASYKYKLAIALIAKDEGDYLQEWLAFHMAMGVDHVFLYDNDSSDQTRDVVQPYIDRGFVTYNMIPGEMRQFDAYNHALKEYGHLCKYMAVIDADEFLMPENPAYNVSDVLDHAFAQSHNIGAIGINWRIYGSSGHLKKEPGMVIERFIYRAETYWDINRHIKSVVKPSCVRLFDHPHYARLHKGYYTAGLHGELIGAWYHPVSENDELRINHYITKSKEESDKRTARKCADTGKYKSSDQFEKFDKNDVKDTIALEYLQEVKKNLL